MPTRIALLGSGIFATSFYLPVLLNSPEVDIRALWSRSKTSAEKIKTLATNGHTPPRSYYGVDGLAELLGNAEIEAVIMALPISAQPDLIIKCLQAGKHVLSEKPVAKDVETAKALIKRYEVEFKPRGLVWRVAENFAHEPILLQTKKLLQDPALGPVLYWQERQELCVIKDSPWHATSWRNIPDYQGGFILDGGVHMTALLRIVLPIPPAKIISTATLHRAHLPPHDLVMALALPPPSSAVAPLGEPLDGDTSIIPVSCGKSSPHGSILLSWAKPDTPSETAHPGYGLFITLENATVSIEMDEGKFIVNVVEAKGSNVESQRIEGESSGIKEEVEQFARASRGDTDEINRGAPEDALWDLAVIQALLTSEGKEVDLDSLIAL